MRAAAAKNRAAAGTVEVLPENWAAMRVWAGMGTQLRRAGISGVPVGLDYAALPAVCGALQIPCDDDLFDRLRVIERAYVAAVLEKL